MNTPDEIQHSLVAGAAQAAPKLTPEQEAQIEETARQLATSTPIPGISTDMLDTAGQVVNTGIEGLAAVADVAALLGTAVEVAAGVAGAIADVVGSIDLGGS